MLIDSGANVDCRAEWLEQFGIMGSAYASAVLDIERPKVALLSIGEERTKGNSLYSKPPHCLRGRQKQDERSGVAATLEVPGDP